MDEIVQTVFLFEKTKGILGKKPEGWQAWRLESWQAIRPEVGRSGIKKMGHGLTQMQTDLKNYISNILIKKYLR